MKITKGFVYIKDLNNEKTHTREKKKNIFPLTFDLAVRVLFFFFNYMAQQNIIVSFLVHKFHRISMF